MGLAQRTRPHQGYGRPHVASEVGTSRPHPTAEASPQVDQRVAKPQRAPCGSCDRTHPRRVKRRRFQLERPAVVQLPVEPLSLLGPPQHGGREHPVSGARPCGTAGGLRAVWLGGVEVRGARRMDRMGSRHAGGEPGVVDQQHALSGVALGRGAALGQPPARVSRSTYSRRLAEQVWTSDSCAGNFRGSQPLPGHLLQGGQLGEAGSNSGAHPQRPESLP